MQSIRDPSSSLCKWCCFTYRQSPATAKKLLSALNTANADKGDGRTLDTENGAHSDTNRLIDTKAS